MTRANTDGYAQEGYEQESRKRPLEGDGGGRDAKRFNSGNEPLLKLLVPNYAAGALIGKGGALLNEIKETYGGFIRLSGGREYYPGTTERIVVITGEVNQIIDICNHVMEKVQDPGREPTMKNVSIDGDRAEKVKIVLTNGASGLLIGRSGATIKAIQETSKAKVSVCMPDKASVPGERVVTVSGSADERSEACRQVIEQVASDASNMANTKTKYVSEDAGTYTSYGVPTGFNSQQQDGRNQYSGNVMPTYQGAGDIYSNQAPSGNTKLKAKVTVEIEVPNVLVGPIMGKQGAIIKNFVQRSGGARFKFSDKSGESEDRTLTITGDMDQTQIAYSLVNERVEQLKNQPNL